MCVLCVGAPLSPRSAQRNVLQAKSVRSVCPRAQHKHTLCQRQNACVLPLNMSRPIAEQLYAEDQHQRSF